MSRAWSWRHAVSKSDLHSTTRLVLHTLALHMSEAGDSCFPSQETIAEESGLGINTVNKHIKIAEDLGWITIKKMGMAGKKWRLNSYSATWPDGFSPNGSRSHSGISPNDEKVFHQMETNIPDNIPDIKNNKKELFKLETEKTKSDPNYIFEKLWKAVLAISPSSRKSQHNKATSRKRFLKIVSGGVAATRLANAVLWFYDEDSQKKDDRRFMYSLKKVLAEEMYDEHLKKGPFTGRKSAPTWADVWRSRAAKYKDNGWHPQWPEPNELDVEYRSYFSEDAQRELGWIGEKS